MKEWATSAKETSIADMSHSVVKAVSHDREAEYVDDKKRLWQINVY